MMVVQLHEQPSGKPCKACATLQLELVQAALDRVAAALGETRSGEVTRASKTNKIILRPVAGLRRKRCPLSSTLPLCAAPGGRSAPSTDADWIGQLWLAPLTSSPSYRPRSRPCPERVFARALGASVKTCGRPRRIPRGWTRARHLSPVRCAGSTCRAPIRLVVEISMPGCSAGLTGSTRVAGATPQPCVLAGRWPAWRAFQCRRVNQWPGLCI